MTTIKTDPAGMAVAAASARTGLTARFRSLRFLAALFTVLAVTGSLTVLSGRSALAGVTGKTPYLVLMCKFAGVANEPFTTAQVSDFFSETGKGKGSMYDFFHDLSYGAIDLSGTTVKGWYQMPFTVADEHRWEHGGQVSAGSSVITLTAGTFRSSDVGKSVYVQSGPSVDVQRAFTSTITAVNSPTQATMASAPTMKDLGGNSLSGVFIGLDKGRGQYIQDCADTAANQDASIDPTGYYGIIAVVNAGAFDGGAAGQGQIPRTVAGHSGKWGWALFDADGLYVSFVGHEMGHTLGLQHSWNDKPATDPKTGLVSPYTEYGDPYDLMSAMTVHWFSGGMALNGVAPAAGPGLNAPYLDQLGWMPSFRQYFYSPGTTVDLPLLALSHATGVGYYEVVIPMADKVGYPGHYLTVEYRYPDGWDKGIGGPAVLIHEVLPDGRSILLTKTSGGPWSAYTVFHDPVDNVAVGIGSFDSTYYPQAWIEVSPDYPGGITPTRPLPGPPQAPTGCEFYGVNMVLCDKQQPPGVSELELGFGGPSSWAFPGLDSEVSMLANGTWSHANYDGRPQLSFDGTGTYSVGVCSVNAWGHACTPPTIVNLQPPPPGGGASGGVGAGNVGPGCPQTGCLPRGHAHE
jgi:hypothetical protein